MISAMVNLLAGVMDKSDCNESANSPLLVRIIHEGLVTLGVTPPNLVRDFIETVTPK